LLHSFSEFIKKDWKVLAWIVFDEENCLVKMFDGDQNTYWSSEANQKGPLYRYRSWEKEYTVTGFNYTPQTTSSEGMIERGVEKLSGRKSWRKILRILRFGNPKK